MSTAGIIFFVSLMIITNLITYFITANNKYIEGYVDCSNENDYLPTHLEGSD